MDIIVLRTKAEGTTRIITKMVIKDALGNAKAILIGMATLGSSLVSRTREAMAMVTTIIE